MLSYAGFKPVSYTHLVVFHMGVAGVAIATIIAQLLSALGCIVSVSYTHLDVYKRQAYACGIGMVHQHFKLIDVLSAAENLSLIHI